MVVSVPTFLSLALHVSPFPPRPPSLPRPFLNDKLFYAFQQNRYHAVRIGAAEGCTDLAHYLLNEAGAGARRSAYLHLREVTEVVGSISVSLSLADPSIIWLPSLEAARWRWLLR